MCVFSSACWLPIGSHRVSDSRKMTQTTLTSFHVYVCVTERKGTIPSVPLEKQQRRRRPILLPIWGKTLVTTAVLRTGSDPAGRLPAVEPPHWNSCCFFFRPFSSYILKSNFLSVEGDYLGEQYFQQ